MAQQQQFESAALFPKNKTKMDFDFSFDDGYRKRRKSPVFHRISVSKRRKFSTKDCRECLICSDQVFEVCHPHISTVEMLKRKGADGYRRDPIWCQICSAKHSDPLVKASNRRKIVLGSSTLAHLWKTEGYQRPPFHIDFDCIIGGQIHDVHLSFLRQYKDISSPMDIILACGMNNIPTTDTEDDIICQFKSFLKSIKNHSDRHKHKKPSRIVICPLLYAPKFCDSKLDDDENYLGKIMAVNEWIYKYNEKNTSLHIYLDEIGVKNVPERVDQKVHHIYDEWNEPQWHRMLHLSSEAKSKVAEEVINVFAKLKD